MLIIALVFGVVAVFLARFWLDAQQRQQVTDVTQPARIETSTIVVATRDLKFGEPLNEDVLREIGWPRTSVPDGAFAKIAEINKDGRRVVLSAIGPNEPVLKWKISGPDARASLSALVTSGMRAVTVKVNDSSGVAGFVLPGDRVDVLYTRQSNDNNSTIDILLQNVRVLAINQVVDEKQSNPIESKVATLELLPIDAQKISLAQATGQLTLALRSAGALDPAPAQRIVEQELVSNPSVYQSAIDAQTVAQAALDARLKGLEGSLTQVALRVDQSKTELTDAQKAAKAELEAQLKSLAKGFEGNLSQVAKRVDASKAALTDAQKAAQADLEAKLKGVLESLSEVSKQVDASKAELTVAQKAARADLEAKLKGVQGSLSQVAKQVDASKAALTDAQKAAQAELTAKLKDIEAKLKGEISNAGASSEQLKAKLAALEAAVKLTARATGLGEVELRRKLSALEAAIKQASSATGEGEEALRARLAEFEASLRQMMSSSSTPVPVVAVTAPPPETPRTVNIKVYRGMKDVSYTVLQDLVTN